MSVMRKQLDQRQLPLAEIKRRCARRDHCAPLPLAFYISLLRVASALAFSFFFSSSNSCFYFGFLDMKTVALVAALSALVVPSLAADFPISRYVQGLTLITRTDAPVVHSVLQRSSPTRSSSNSPTQASSPAMVQATPTSTPASSPTSNAVYPKAPTASARTTPQPYSAASLSTSTISTTSSL